MDHEKLARRLLATFQEELPEHVGALNENLLALEKEPRGLETEERIRSLFRAAHSLKGAARSVGLKPIEEACHHLEEILRAVQGGDFALGEEAFSLLFAAADALADARTRLAAGEPLSKGPLIEVIPRLAAMAAKQSSRPREAYVPRARPAVPTASAVAPPEPAAAPEPAPVVAVAAESQVRVASSKLDLLLARSGELLVAERRLERNEASLAAVGESLAQLQRKRGAADAESRLKLARADLDRLAASLRDDRRAIGRAVALMDEEVRRVRLLPFAEACRGLDRAIRDLAKERGKEVEVVIEGAALELDRSILEGLRDPLLALARNAVDHGIEPLTKRGSKPAKGRVVIAAALRGQRLEVSVEDDGAGVDLAGVRSRAAERGLQVPRDDRDCFALLFEPGFSTAAKVTDISGRGVGLDIVKTRVTGLHGTVEPTSRPGNGTRVELRLPATLTTLRALLVSAGGETLAIPGESVVRLIRIDPKEVRSIGGREVVSTGVGPPTPIFSLARVLSLPEREGRNGKIPAAVIGGPTPLAFAVDALISEREILVKTLGPRLRHASKVAGATVLETGHVALILNVAEVTRAAFERTGEAPLAADRAAPVSRRRILLADDSATTRGMERAILEAAGYEVMTAVDGEQAFRLLHDRGADLVVSDIDMPRMDGLTLCKAVRGSKRFRDLPLVLVSGLESAQDRARGGAAGADAYIVKSGFDQRDLLTTVAQLLGGEP